MTPTAPSYVLAPLPGETRAQLRNRIHAVLPDVHAAVKKARGKNRVRLEAERDALRELLRRNVPTCKTCGRMLTEIVFRAVLSESRSVSYHHGDPWKASERPDWEADRDHNPEPADLPAVP